MAENTILLRTRVPARRLKQAEKVLAKLGLKPGEAVNMLLAQIELRQALPFEVTIAAKPLLLLASRRGFRRRRQSMCKALQASIQNGSRAGWAFYRSPTLTP